MKGRLAHVAPWFAATCLASALFGAVTEAAPPRSGPIHDGPELDYQPAFIRQEPSGRLLVVFERLDPATLSGAFLATYSDSGGASWSTPRPILSSPPSVRHPALVQLGRQSFTLLYLMEEQPGEYRIHRAVSRDGLSWEHQGRVDLGWEEPGEINPSIALLPGGELAMTYHRLGGRAYIARSSDGGETWDRERTFVTASSAALPRVAYRAIDGRYIVTFQTNPGDNRLNLWMKTSLDPSDWERSALPVSYGLNTHDSYPLVLPSGELVVFYARQSGSGFDLHFRRSTDLVSFSDEVRLTDNPNRFDTQPHPLLLESGEEAALVWPRQDSREPYQDHDVWFAPRLDLAPVVHREVYLPLAANASMASSDRSWRAMSAITLKGSVR